MSGVTKQQRRFITRKQLITNIIFLSHEHSDLIILYFCLSILSAVCVARRFRYAENKVADPVSREI